MSESIYFDSGMTKEERYAALLPQLEALIANETDNVANMANISAALREVFGFFWVGFYRLVNDELVLGPFQGPIACTRIRFGRGVCGTAWSKGQTIIVADVDAFPGHIACSSASRSEIVVPIYSNTVFWGVLDVDSDSLDAFDEIDEQYLNAICKLFAERCYAARCE